jgi:hypothetical protein
VRRAGFLSAAVVAACVLMGSVAQAQTQRAPAPAQTAGPAEAPWYERFTFGSEFSAGANAWAPRGEPKASVQVSPRSRWGVTFGLGTQSQRPIDPTLGRGNRTTAGAFYQISPKFRVGGAVVLPEETRAVTPQGRRTEEAKREPGVKVESAFRF